jgi:hypothetical protein
MTSFHQIDPWFVSYTIPAGVKAAFRNLAQCYEAIGKTERFKTYTLDGPHSFPARAQQPMLEWFDRSFRPRYGPQNENLVLVL